MDESRLLLSRIDDLVYKSYCGEIEGLGFLNEAEVSLAHNYLCNLHVSHCFYGGYENAFRMYLYISESSDSFHDILPLHIKTKGENNLLHKDYLGSLMGLGITRECVGDILIVSDGAVAFVRNEIAEYVIMNLNSVGRNNVNVSEYTGDCSQFSSAFSEINVVVTSMRIDNFLTSVCKCSRGKAAEYINEDKVFVNYSCVTKASKTLDVGDVISIRGFGKYKIAEEIRNTKSGRLVLSVKKYK